jgi:hypothetical protein
MKNFCKKFINKEAGEVKPIEENAKGAKKKD